MILVNTATWGSIPLLMLNPELQIAAAVVTTYTTRTQLIFTSFTMRPMNCNFILLVNKSIDWHAHRNPPFRDR
jgi:hypothetical protein